MVNGDWQGFMISPGMAALELTLTIEERGEASGITWVAGTFPARDVEIGSDWYKFTWSPAFEVICLIKKRDNGTWSGACKDESGGKGVFVVAPPNRSPAVPEEMDFEDSVMIWEQMEPKKIEEFIPKIEASKQLVLDGTKYNYVSTGQGDVTVVFENGEADELRVWSEVYSKVGEFAKVFLYDRAGQGKSEARNGTRDSDTIADELRRLLKAAGQESPFLLVGHSAGALYARSFAGKYISDVKGLVLIDPLHEGEKMELSKLDPSSWTKYLNGQKMLSQLAPDPVQAEFEEVLKVIETGSFSDGLADLSVPANVLTHFNPKKQPRWVGESRDGQLAIQALHKSLADRFANGKLIVYPRGNGYIHRENPEMVVNAIRALVEK